MAVVEGLSAICAVCRARGMLSKCLYSEGVDKTSGIPEVLRFMERDPVVNIVRPKSAAAIVARADCLFSDWQDIGTCSMAAAVLERGFVSSGC